MSKTLTAYEAKFTATLLACFPQVGEKIYTGKAGRPPECDIVYVVNNARAELNDQAREIAEKDPFLAMRIFAKYHLALTDEQRIEIRESKDGTFQPIDPKTGHIIQGVRGGIDCGTLDDVEFYYESCALPMAQAFANRTGEKQFVRLARWVVTREHRGKGGNGKTLLNRTAPFSHKLYVHADVTKEEAAFLTLAIVHPGGRIERLGKGPKKAPAKARKATPRKRATRVKATA